MGHPNLASCVKDLEQSGQLRRVDHPVDPDQEIAAIQRRVTAAGGPALLFTRVRGTPLPMLANLFGTRERTRYIFRDTLATLEKLFALKLDPMEAFRRPHRYLGMPSALSHTLPRRVRKGPILGGMIRVSQLPCLRSWPHDAGGFVTLPQVYTEDPDKPGFKGSNLGMYRVQLSGGSYEPEREVGLHYQIHRGIGPHHAKALARGEALRVNVFVGGPPAMTLAAIMPLPEGLPELLFAGVLAGRRIPFVPAANGLPMPAEADVVISGRVLPGALKPEGPFGDHLGYYSLTHDFPVLTVDAVHCRPDAIWPFTTVGRPPQEDSVFGEFIHELTGPLAPRVFPGLHELHAVDEAGVHPLLLALASERYVPFAAERRPQELLTIGLSLLGQTQTSLSKYVFIAAREDAPGLSTHDYPGFFRHLLERVDLERDLHFITRTTIDTLDYSGVSLNQGSKLLLAVAGPKRRELAMELPPVMSLPRGFGDPRLAAPGIMVLQGPPHEGGRDQADGRLGALGKHLERQPGVEELTGLPLIVVVDDAEFTARNWANFLWVVFTRSDPATDCYGAGVSQRLKHWGCNNLIVDARLKTYHAPALEEDPDVARRAEALAAKGGPLEGLY